jgi:ribulose-phosphate 3-epimerase
MGMVLIKASILAADFARLGEQVREAEAAGVDGFQVDVMDGTFVPNITFGPGVVRAIRPLVHTTLEMDLMIINPERHLPSFVDAGADRVIVHQEACAHLYRVLQSIRDLEVEVGVAVSPGTPISVIEEVLELVDLVQVMTVSPGFGGQSFLRGQLDKIRRLRRMLDDRGLDLPIGVDGGINPRTAPLVVEAGATQLVAGSSVYRGAGSIAENLERLRASVR